ncbi:hypothetical protein B7982_02365 [Fibrobacter sp. UWB2]|uniref:hypothetical protein n=1 Tax=Fibrobacter sp. UWB2 TaxID=1964358 RepID=UPI000B52288B|nr:hypothetical protein [Fibrobacter sp. UWB2]OWV24578.1 hypothetical protein B7982_02365 [Fibrobacter sp. UWB2]
MKIEKKKVTGNSRLSSATKAGVASLLGMSAVLMSGCLGDAESGQVIGPVEPDNNNPNSSDASETPEIQSSSSIVDIPLSHERLSSEAVETLSSSSVQSPSSSSVAPIQSSSSEKTVSSSSESSSSTFVEKPRSSSSVKEESSSSTEVVPPWVGPGRNCNYIDSMGVNVIMCHDDDDFPLVSMVSTYEMFDNA